jgi:hypothetical protein
VWYNFFVLPCYVSLPSISGFWEDWDYTFSSIFFGSCFFGMASFHSFHALLAWFISGSCFVGMASFNFYHALLTWFISI